MFGRKRKAAKEAGMPKTTTEVGEFKDASSEAAAQRQPQEVQRRHMRTLSRIAAIAVVGMICAAGFGVYAFMTTSTERESMTADTVEVVIAKEAIPLGTTVTSDMLTTEEVPSRYLSSSVVTDESDIIGNAAVMTISKNSQVTTGMVASASNTSSLANLLDPDMVAVTVSTSAETGVGQLLRQGDTVDVLGTDKASSGVSTTQVVVSNVKVLALDTSMTTASSTYSSVTLAVDEADAIAIREAEQDGTLSLILHSAAATTKD